MHSIRNAERLYLRIGREKPESGPISRTAELPIPELMESSLISPSSPWMPIVSARQLGKIYSKVAAVKPRLLGVDVGTMNVGLALSDPSLSVAVPLTTLKRSDCAPLSCFVSV